MHFYLVCNMNKIGRVFVIYILVVAATGAVEENLKKQANSKTEYSSKPKEQTKASHVSAQAVINHDMVGVASIAGVDSRYGRVSSMNGVKIYPPVDSSMVKTDSKGNFIFKSANGKMPMPITITKQGDGVSGTIRIAPGSVSVSSSANSGGSSAVSGHRIPGLNPWPMPFMKPMMHDFYFPDPFISFPSIPNSYHARMPDSGFHRITEPSYPRISQPSFPRMQDPWMEKDLFKHSLPMHNLLRPSWYYPNPFINFW